MSIQALQKNIRAPNAYDIISYMRSVDGLFNFFACEVSPFPHSASWAMMWISRLSPLRHLLSSAHRLFFGEWVIWFRSKFGANPAPPQDTVNVFSPQLHMEYLYFAPFTFYSRRGKTARSAGLWTSPVKSVVVAFALIEPVCDSAFSIGINRNVHSVVTVETRRRIWKFAQKCLTSPDHKAAYSN